MSPLFRYDVDQCLYPEYLKHGNVCQFITPTAQYFCKGDGLDVGAGRWPFPNATPVDISMDDPNSRDAQKLPKNGERIFWDYIFSSHCLEHLEDYIAALKHWQESLTPGGCLFLYLPHPDMTYWRPEYCRKHRHQFLPAQMAGTLRALGFVDVIHSERDLAWSFAVVGFKADAA